MFRGNGFQFDKLSHSYFIKMISVSELCKEILGDEYQDVPSKILSKAQQRGICVHKQIEDYINVGYNWNCECDPAVKNHEIMFNYLKNYYNNSILKNHNKQFIFKAELMIYKEIKGLWIPGTTDMVYTKANKELWIAGTIDYINEYLIVDWKTSSTTEPSMSNILQIWLYNQLLDKPRPNLAIVNANKKWVYHLNKIDNQKCNNLFTNWLKEQGYV